jgi:sugar phosphate isomerase/epimerase
MNDIALTRRKLLGAGVGLAAGAVAVGEATAAPPTDPTHARSGGQPSALPAPLALLPADRLGIQLYTVRDKIAELGFGRVFELLAEIGLGHVEFAGLTEGSKLISPKKIRRLLDLNGLTGLGNASVTFSNPPLSDAAIERMLNDAETLGLPAIGVSFVNPAANTTAGWQAEAHKFNHYGALAAKRGMRFVVHNHFQEWAPLDDNPRGRGEDVLLGETDSRHVVFEMDIYWAFVGRWQTRNTLKFDPLRDYAIPHRHRYVNFHVKDGKTDQTGGFTDAFGDIVDLGEGNIDYVGFFTDFLRHTTGEQPRHWYILERDNASDHPRGSLAAAQVSYLYLRYGIAHSMGFGGQA